MMEGGVGCGGDVDDDDGQGFFISVKVSLVRSDVTDVVWLVRPESSRARSRQPGKIRSPRGKLKRHHGNTSKIYLNAVWICRCKLILTLSLISRTQLDTP